MDKSSSMTSRMKNTHETAVDESKKLSININSTTNESPTLKSTPPGCGSGGSGGGSGGGGGGTRFKFSNILEKSVNTVASIINNPPTDPIASSINNHTNNTTNARVSFDESHLDDADSELNSSGGIGGKKTLFKACLS